jgi:hypothetical protein
MPDVLSVKIEQFFAGQLAQSSLFAHRGNLQDMNTTETGHFSS